MRSIKTFIETSVIHRLGNRWPFVNALFKKAQYAKLCKSIALLDSEDPRLSQPIFIWGAPRSGTFLLYDILSLHGNILYVSAFQKAWLGVIRACGVIFTGESRTQKFVHLDCPQQRAAGVFLPITRKMCLG